MVGLEVSVLSRLAQDTPFIDLLSSSLYFTAELSEANLRPLSTLRDRSGRESGLPTGPLFYVNDHTGRLSWASREQIQIVRPSGIGLSILNKRAIEIGLIRFVIWTLMLDTKHNR